MADAKLRELWDAVRNDFNRAAALLPPIARTMGEQQARLDEWLDHNELELALHELEAIGQESAAPQSFWLMLQSAAERMGLEEDAAEYAKRARS